MHCKTSQSQPLFMLHVGFLPKSLPFDLMRRANRDGCRSIQPRLELRLLRYRLADSRGLPGRAGPHMFGLFYGPILTLLASARLRLCKKRYGKVDSLKLASVAAQKVELNEQIAPIDRSGGRSDASSVRFADYLPTIRRTISSLEVSDGRRSPAFSPRRNTTMRSATSKISRRLCEMNITPLPWAFSD